MNREEVIAAVEKQRLIVIARGLDTEELIHTADAMYEGGVRLMEVTFDALGNPPDEVVAERIGLLARRFAGKMYIGAGTVLTAAQVDLTFHAGGQFIISPVYSASVIQRTRELGMVSIPGAMTPTEALTATELGADFVKIFPNSELKPAYIKALTAPLSQIRFLAVGGVTLDNMREYLDAGAVGIGVANGIVNKKLIKAGDFAGVTELARSYTSGLAH